MALHIECIASSEVPVEVEGVTPDVMQPMNLDQIKRLKIFQGNREMELADLFNVQGDPIDGEVHWNGDLTGVHWIGAKMSAGKVTVHGSAGRHVGSECRGAESMLWEIPVTGWVVKCTAVPSMYGAGQGT